jgi:hypothetical protein
MKAPDGMATAAWATIRGLSDRPTSQHPFGLQYAVLERAAILIYEAGLSPAEADMRALAETVPGWAPGLFDGWEGQE